MYVCIYTRDNVPSIRAYVHTRDVLSRRERISSPTREFNTEQASRVMADTWSIVFREGKVSRSSTKGSSPVYCTRFTCIIEGKRTRMLVNACAMRIGLEAIWWLNARAKHAFIYLTRFKRSNIFFSSSIYSYTSFCHKSCKEIKNKRYVKLVGCVVHEIRHERGQCHYRNLENY